MKDDRQSKRGAVEVFLPRPFANALLSMLSVFAAADGENRYGVYARNIKSKILRHGRTFEHEGDDNVAVYFYPDEAALLIKLCAIYICAIDDTGDDFFSEIGKPRYRR